jgi:CxxC-x17-CxxC domain-containing protein
MGGEGTAITLVGYGEIAELNRIKSLTKTAIKEIESDIEMQYEPFPKTHKAVCTDCGKECEVPFKPDPSRPVYCRECYTKRRPLMKRF